MTTNSDEEFSEKMTGLLLDVLDCKATPNGVGYLNGGGSIFEEVTAYPDYYLFSSEKSLLASKGGYIAHDIQDTQRVIVVGQGAALMDKEWHVISRLPNLQKIHLLDISHVFNAIGLGALEANRTSLPAKVCFSALSANFHDVAAQPLQDINPENLVTTVICTGSLISNIDNPPKDAFPREGTKSALYALERLTGGKGHVIVGFDTNDDLQKLDKAYKQNPANAKFHRNELAYLLRHSKGIEFRDASGAVIPGDRDVLKTLFTVSTPDRFDLYIRNYFHDLKPSQPIFAHIDTPSRQEVIPVGSLRMMNCFKSRATLNTKLAIEASANDKDFSVTSGFDYGLDGMVVQTFHVKPRLPDSAP